MTISLQKRFEILTRDRFTCRFCGRRAPETELEVDHVHPRSRGGTDDQANLVTACRDCNRGKGDRLITLDEPSDWNSLEGKFFHILDDDGYVADQGEIVGTVAPGVYVVELFDFLHGGFAERRLVTIEQMAASPCRWIFHTDSAAMNESYKYGYHRGRPSALPEWESALFSGPSNVKEN